MKCFLPFVDELSAASARLLRIAQLMGAECVPVRLPRESVNPVGDLESALTEAAGCFAICPDVVRAWLGTDVLSSALASCLLMRFKFLLVHELDTDLVSTNLVRALSDEAVVGVQSIEDPHCGYQVASEELCGAFSGLKFGPAKREDRVLEAKSGQQSLYSIISIDGKPLFAGMRLKHTEVFFLAGAVSEDIGRDFSGRKVPEFFAELLPLAMFLRHAFRLECWRPANPPRATFIVDDPPLWKRYGFLNYQQLLTLMDEFNFHTTIAFIPYYWKDSFLSTVRLFRQRPDRFSICFHGNDHTAGELASQDFAALDYLLAKARSRMNSFTTATGIRCDDVMVFPQGAFSRNAIHSLKDSGFVGAVNSGHSPQGEEERLTFAELIQPSILRENAFPLFLRKYVKDVRPEDVAFNVFFGRPILLVEHHEIFRDPSPLLELVSTINEMIPQVRWSNIQDSLQDACLVRQDVGGTLYYRPYARVGRITNSGSSLLRCVAEWPPETSFEDSQDSIWLDEAKYSRSRTMILVPKSLLRSLRELLGQPR